MFSKEQFTDENFDKELVAAVGDRLQNGMYSDAILAGAKHLTEVLRAKGGVSSDGVALAGQVLGGTPPKLPLNKLQTQSEKDEQKGVLQLVLGFYTGVRNPRTHDHVDDTEDYCIRMLIFIDTLLQYLNREVEDFDATKIVNRIYEPHFVPSREYAQLLVSEIPEKQALLVFTEAFERRSEGKSSDIENVFKAMIDTMTDEDAAIATNMVGQKLDVAEEHSEIADLLRLLKPSAWPLLEKKVRLRLENTIITECSKGYFNVYGGLGGGGLGSWGNTFGHYFERRDELATVLINRLHDNWYTQNYVAKYFIFALPRIVTGTEMIKKVADGLAYAAIVNQAKVLRTKLLEACGNYPEEWKEALRIAVQERKDSDEQYANSLLEKLG